MKKTLGQSGRRVGVAEAKADLSRVLREAPEGPIVIHNRGRDVAVVLGIEEYERIVSNDHARGSSMQELLRGIEELKSRFGGGAELDAKPIEYEPTDPFRTRTG